MSRGLAVADTATSLPADPKVNSLWRLLRDKAAMCEARTVYEDTRLASWAAGERVAAEEAASLWYEPDPRVLAALVEVGLLDEGHRIPGHVWDSWFGPAWARTQHLRDLASRGGKATAAARAGASPASPTLPPAVAPATPHATPGATPSAMYRPSVRPSGRPSGRAPAREAALKEPTNGEVTTARNDPGAVLPEPPGLPSKEEAARRLAAIREATGLRAPGPVAPPLTAETPEEAERPPAPPPPPERHGDGTEALPAKPAQPPPPARPARGADTGLTPAQVALRAAARALFHPEERLP